MTFLMGLLAGALIVLFIITIYQTINKRYTPLLAVPFTLLPVLFMGYSQVHLMNKDLKSRNQN